MDFALDDDHHMLKELAEKFVRDELVPLEPALLAREARGEPLALSDAERAAVDQKSRDLGLWGMDAPADVGGADLPAVAVLGVNIALGHTIAPYVFPPDSPNLRMLAATVNDEQRQRYLVPYVAGKTVSAIAISEPGAGADPAGMTTRAVRDADGWVLNGRKIWISKADHADFTIVMAVSDREAGRRAGISAFLVDRGTPGMIVERRIPMLGGHHTFEVVFDDCRLPAGALLGREGAGFAPMQTRLATRRLEMAAWCIGAAQRALDMMVAHVRERKTFGEPLSERQAIQWWIADAATRIRACTLSAYDIAWRLDRGEDVRTLVSMIKVEGTEMAGSVIDNAMQAFGAMGMTKEMPLQLMAAQARLMRIYDGPSEVHRWVVARDVLRRG